MESDLPFDLEARGCRPLQSSQHHPENQQEHTDVMWPLCFCKSPKHSLKVAHISILTLKPFGPGRPICPAGPLPPVEPAGPGLPSSPAKPWKDPKKNE